MAPLLSNRKLQYLSLAYIGSLICQCRQGGSPAEALSIAPAMLGMAASELLPNLVAGEVQGGGGAEERHIWPSEHVLNEHLARAVRTAVAGILHLTANQLEGEDQLSVLRLMNAVETHWLELPFDLRDALKPIAETEIPKLLGKSLEDLTQDKPIKAADWENILDAVLIYANEIEMSEPVFQHLCKTLEERFVPALFSVICHEPTASSKLQILEINRVADIVNGMSGKFTEIEKAIRDVSASITRSEERIKRAINAPFAPPQNPVQTSFDKNDPISGFYFGTQLIPIIRRQSELKLLKESWLQLEAKFSWISMLGPAGSGKSRLALELLERLPNDWDGFFLQAATTPESAYKDWRHWQPEANTVIVVDYAASRHENLSEMLRELAERGSSSSYRPLNFKIRILCLERTVAGSRVATAVTKLNPADSIRVKSCLFSPQSLQIGATPDQKTAGFDHWILPDFTEQDLGQIVLQYFEAYGGKDRKWSALEMGRKLRGVSSASRPLFAAFLGQQLATGHDLKNWEPLDLAREILYQEVRRWSRLGIPSNLVNQYFLATVLGSYKNNQFQEECLKLSPGEFSKFAPLIAGLSGIEQDELSKLEPDFLGELFVLKRLDGSLVLQDLEEAPDISKSSSHVLKIAKDQESFQSAEFYLRAHQNFPNLSESLKPLFVSDSETVDVDVASQTLSTYFDQNRWDELSNKVETESAKWLLHSNGDSYATAMALTTESADPGSPADLILERLKASNYPEQYGQALYNVIANREVKSLQDSLYRDLKYLHDQNSSNEAIRISLASATYSVAFHSQVSELHDPCMHILRQQYEFDPNCDGTRNMWAMGLYLTLRTSEESSVTNERVLALEQLRDRFPYDSLILRMWSNALYGLCYVANVSQLSDVRASKLQSLWLLAHEHESVRLNWSNFLYSTCSLDGIASLSDPRMVLLAECWNRYPNDPEIRRNWCSAQYSMCIKESVKDVNDPRLVNLRLAWERYPRSVETVQNFANGLYSALYEESAIDMSDIRVTYIKSIWETNPDLEIAHRTWTNTIYLVLINGKVSELNHPAMKLMKQAVDAYSDQEAVRNNWANSLYNALHIRPSSTLTDLRVIHLQSLYEAFPESPTIEKAWVDALYLMCLRANVYDIDDPIFHLFRKLWEVRRSEYIGENLTNALYSACIASKVSDLNDERYLLIEQVYKELPQVPSVRSNMASALYNMIYTNDIADLSDARMKRLQELYLSDPSDEGIVTSWGNAVYVALLTDRVSNLSDLRFKSLEELHRANPTNENVRKSWSNSLYNLVIWNDSDFVLSFALNEAQKLVSNHKNQFVIDNWCRMLFLMANNAKDRFRAQEFLDQSIDYGLISLIVKEEWFSTAYQNLRLKWSFTDAELGLS